MTTAATDPPKISMLDMPMQRDREAGWQMLADRGPLVEVDGQMFCTTVAGIEHMLQNPGIYSSRAAYEFIGSPVPQVPLMFDPPEVLRYRRLLAPFFSPGVINRLYDDLRGQLRDLITPMAARGHCDVMPELAIPFPSHVFLTLMGLPLSDSERLIGWKDAVMGAANPAGGGSDLVAVNELIAYLKEIIASRKGQSGDDLLTRVVNDPTPDAMNDDETLGMSFLLVNAGLDTVTGTLGLGFALLAEDPALQAQLAADPSLMPQFVEEVVRLNPVAAFVPRTTTQETELEGYTLPAGTVVTMAIAVANRDPDAYAQPLDLDLARGGHHWGFGGGVHRCLGSHLARAELQLVFQEWLAQVPSFGYAEGFTPEMPWPVALLGLESVQLTY